MMICTYITVDFHSNSFIHLCNVLFSFSYNFISNKENLHILFIISQILRVVGPLGKKLIVFSLLRFEIQKHYDFQTLKFKFHSFIPCQR